MFFKLRLEIIEKSLSISIWNKLFFLNELNIVNFSLESFLSVSTIKRKFKRLNSLLESYDFMITSKDNIYMLQGNETNIRYFSSSLFWNIYNGAKWPFYNIDQRKIIKLIDATTEDLSFPISYSLNSRFSYSFAVGITRYFHNQTINLEQNDEWDKLKKINNSLTNHLSTNIIKMLVEDYLLSEDEAHYEFSRLQIVKSFYKDQKTIVVAIELHEKFETSIYKASVKFIELLEKHAHINLSEDQKKKVMVSALCGHYKSFFYHDIPILKQEIDGILINYYSLRSLVERIYSELCESVGTCIFKQKNFLINQYMYTISEILPLNYFEAEISIYFDESIDLPIEQLVKNMLNNFFKEPFNLRIYGPSDILHFNKNDIDLVLSSTYTEKIIDNYPNTPIMFLKSSILNLSEREILQLKEILSIINRNNKDRSKIICELKKMRNLLINET
ncbi:hypothetical protein GIX45_16675 [Erwinia sp. CPCC 100877]|nr:hypothetical protein [Erwinia sp. CPCC 100877]